ncbi:MAG: hypothetical protein ACWGSQ_15705, partial [Longimicrobiales bacterium]
MQATGNRFKVFSVSSLALGLGLLLPAPSMGQADEPVVHAVLFYSPTCPHCHDLINNHLIPLQEQYGRRFVILAFDVTQGWASEIYWGMLRFYEIPQEEWVVPIVVVKDEVLVGGDEIPLRLTQIIEEGLAGDGVDLPNLPPLLTFLEEEGILDPRYPDRRIVIQEPPPADVPAEEGVETPDAPPPAGDSAPGVDTLPPAPDTPAVEPDAVAPDTQAMGTAARAGEAPAPGAGAPADSLAREGQDTPGAGDAVPPGPGDSTRPPVASPSGAPAPDEGRAAEEREGEPSPDSTASVIDSAGPHPGGGEPSTPGDAREARTMDLAGAAREMGSMTMADRFNQDRAGNSLSVVVLVGMLVTLILRGWPPRTP